MTEVTDQLMYEDNLTIARKYTDTRRYVADRWNAAHTEPIDEEQVALFLADAHYGKLTEAQKQFVCDCRDEMNSVYRDIEFRMLQYQEMVRRGMVSDLMSFCRIYLSDSPTGVRMINADLHPKKRSRRKERRSSGAAPLTNARSAGISGLLKERFFRWKNRRLTLLSGVKPERAHKSRRFSDAISNSEVVL